MPDIFLSYSRDDQATARRFAESFEREGFSVWWDQTLRSGENYDQVTEAALREAKAVVVLWSKKSVDSRWVRAEATQADRLGTLMPAMIEPCNRPIMFELKHTAELAHWKGEANDPVWRSFLSDVRRFVQKDASPAPGPITVGGGHSSPRDAKHMGLVAAVVLVLGAGALWAIFGRDGHSTSETIASSASEPTAGPVTLAVLPFVNLSSDPEQEYFSDGLTEEILNQLAQNKGLRVTGRTSSFTFKGKNEDLRAIAGKLGVANLLEGSVRRDGAALRITAQLISGGDGAHLWSHTYDRELDKVFAVQEEIARDVAKALSVTLDVSDMNRAQGGTTDVEAYDRFLRGRQLILVDERSASAEAVSQFREAVTLDPSFSRAWLELNSALQVRLLFSPEDEAALRPQIVESAERVKTLAPDAWWTRLLIAREMQRTRRWSEAEASINAAIAEFAGRQSPLELVIGYVEMMWSVGRVREGLVVGERATAQDPLAMNLARPVQAMLDCAGRPEDAQREYERVKALVGSQAPLDTWALVRLLMREDADPATIRSQFRVVAGARPTSNNLTSELAERYTDRASALQVVRRRFDEAMTQGAVAAWAAGIYGDRFGDKDLALTAMRRVAFLPEALVNTFWFPQRTGLRSDPRFKDLVRDVGLEDYWRSSGKWADYCKPVGANDFECQ